MLYDPHLSRLYVTNPSTGPSMCLRLRAASIPATRPTILPPCSTISMAAGATSPCPTGCSPVSVAALPDGSRFYVASYQNRGLPGCKCRSHSACIIPMLTVYDALSLTVKPITATLLAPSLSLLALPQFAPAVCVASGSVLLPPDALHTGFDPIPHLHHCRRRQQPCLRQHLRCRIDRRHQHHHKHYLQRRQQYPRHAGHRPRRPLAACGLSPYRGGDYGILDCFERGYFQAANNFVAGENFNLGLTKDSSGDGTI